MYEEKAAEESFKEKRVCQKCKEDFPSNSDLTNNVG
jgi:hypothetical protein